MDERPLQEVLYVEDDPDIRVVARMALETLGGLRVCCCDGGAQALAALDRCRPDVVLLDVMMPDLDGPATLALLRQHPVGRDLPVIFMTAKAQAHEVRHYLSLGAAGVITKPFDPMTLADQVRALWRQAA